MITIPMNEEESSDEEELDEDVRIDYRIVQLYNET